MYIKFDEFIERSDKLTFSFDGKDFENTFEKLEYLEAKKRSQNIIDIEKNVFSNLLSIKSHSDKIAILCGGGIDSNYLLLALLELGVEPVVLAARTKSNKKSLRSTKAIVDKYNLQFYVFSYCERDLEVAINEFYDVEKRLPNDPAMPIIWCLYHEAIKIGADAVIDGQYADTVLFANPQNYLFSRTKRVKLPELFQLDDKIESFPKIVSGLYYLSMPIEKRILFLCRVNASEEATDFVHELLLRFDADSVLQCIFYNFLLEKRERDKYKLISQKFYSPFDSFDFLCESVKSKRRGKSQKEFMVRYIKARVPEAAKLMKSMSFEAK